MTTKIINAIEEFEAMRVKSPEPTDDFWNKCLDESDERYQGQFPRLNKQAFILGCAHGYGAAFSDIKQAANRATHFTKALRSAIEALKFYADHPIVIKEAYHSNEERQITCMHTFINHKAVETLKEIERILLEEK